ncbi:MAG: hypothetical protein Q8829_02500 [Candidatus Phytoplasma australasiaticum]|nr:hypothetical protein [Candidatus Phytoplasma australasiaticum]
MKKIKVLWYQNDDFLKKNFLNFLIKNFQNISHGAKKNVQKI